MNVRQLIYVLVSCTIVISMLCVVLEYKTLPVKEGKNAKIAYEYHIERTNCTGSNCGPSCSLQARMWIDEYRQDHNLTHKQFLCAVWFNDMDDWFYY